MSRETRHHHKSVRLTGEFIGRDESTKSEGGTPKQSSMREMLESIIKSHYFANFMAVLVLVDTVCTCNAIDARAAGGSASLPVLMVSDFCLVVYTLEALTWVCLAGLPILKDWMMIMDLGIVSCGWAEIILAQFTAAADVLGFRIKVLRVLRLVRILRPIRLLKRVRALRELYKLAMMMATVFRTLLWCFLLCFIVMTGWAMLVVEIVYPAVKDMQTNGFLTDCPQCERATSTVMEANLLLFKTVIAGDSWGEIAVPVIQEHPGTAIIFVGSLLSIVFGVVNLIVAVVVDTFADARQNDVQNLAEEMEDEIEHDRKALAKVFQRIDKDESGQLTLEELIQGARRDGAFQSRLRVMDIDEQDLEQLFQMIDADQSGTIEIAEFIGPLSRWAHDSKTAPRFIKYNMLQTMHLQEDMYDLSLNCFRELADRIDELALEIASTRREGLAGSKTRHQEEPMEGPTPTDYPTMVPSDRSIGAIKEDGFGDLQVAKAPSSTAASIDTTDVSIQTAILKIEAKLDSLYQESRKPRMFRGDSLRSLRPSSPPSGVGERASTKRPLDPAAFRSLYMRKATMTSSPPLFMPSDGLHSWASASAETYNPFAASSDPKRLNKIKIHEREERPHRSVSMETINEDEVVMENSYI